MASVMLSSMIKKIISRGSSNLMETCGGYFGTHVVQCGPNTIQVHKVKGHVAQAHVECGEVLEQHKKGDDHANNAATRGVMGTGKETLILATWIKKRYKKYLDLNLSTAKIMADILRTGAAKSNEVKK